MAEYFMIYSCWRSKVLAYVRASISLRDVLAAMFQSYPSQPIFLVALNKIIVCTILDNALSVFIISFTEHIVVLRRQSLCCRSSNFSKGDKCCVRLKHLGGAEP